MKRRLFLAGTIGCLVSLAGCINDGSTPGSAGTTSSSTPTETPTLEPSTTITESVSSPTTQPTSPGIKNTPPDPTIIQFEKLSPEARKEVRIAIEQGKYTSCEEPLAVMNEFEKIRTPVVKYEAQRYRPAIMVGSGNVSGSNCEKYILRMEKW